MVRNLLGPIPDDYFENDPIYPPKNVSPLSQALLDHIELVRANTGSDKYRPGDYVGGY
jgi:hypothetical protein